jgi:hypothetical protein
LAGSTTQPALSFSKRASPPPEEIERFVAASTGIFLRAFAPA